MNEQKLVKCTVTRASNPADTSDIFVAENGHTFLIKPGKTVELPLGIYNILKDSVTPFTKLEEGEDGQVRSVTVEGHEYAIIVDGVEATAEADSRFAKIAKEKAAEVDTLSAENEQLAKKVAVLESDKVATSSIALENEELKKRIAELEAKNAE